MIPKSNLSPMELLKIQASTLYTFNEHQRLLSINEPGGGQAPAIFIGVTSAGSLTYYHEQLPPNLVAELGIVSQLPLDIPKIIQMVETFELVNRVWMGPAYAFPETSDEWDLKVQLIGQEQRYLLAEHFPELKDHLHEKNLLPLMLLTVLLWQCASLQGSPFMVQRRASIRPLVIEDMDMQQRR